ncbi:WAT1-related protein At3g28050-like isoform X2 [Mangifera indica]|uniref:WAT1-related protein At3g28050-like isoform X2 n=1 Tax=Mangifera indica TaxID=29780 RepID=UPI001CFA5557|nr:WAT1-related protein At3g28050-like isoform X2 [Mangifera indica]
MWSPSVTQVMVTLEVLDVGLNTVTKAAMSGGLSHFVLVVYSNILAIFFLLPCSFIFYRKSSRPQLTRHIVYRIFILGLVSCCGQMFNYIGIEYSSPTLASAMIDLTPGFTFLLAVISRMENLDLRVQSSQAKSIGTLVLITGALIVTLYKGLPITVVPSTKKLLKGFILSSQSHWALGGFFLAVHSVVLALYYIIQAWIIRDYPAELMVTLICCIFVTILSATVSLVAEKDANAWKLGPNIDLMAIGYSAAFAVSLRSALHTWAIKKKGPVYVSMFKPLGMVIAIVSGVTLLGDTLYLGSLVGAATIALGFYAVIWGQAQEKLRVDDNGIGSFKSSSQKVPLLQNMTCKYRTFA